MPNEYVPFSAAWFTLSLINAGLAQSKGRSGRQWWLASLFIGPIATLLIVAQPSLLPGQREFPAGTMSRTQAVVIGVIILAVALGIFAGVGYLGGNGL